MLSGGSVVWSIPALARAPAQPSRRPAAASRALPLDAVRRTCTGRCLPRTVRSRVIEALTPRRGLRGVVLSRTHRRVLPVEGDARCPDPENNGADVAAWNPPATIVIPATGALTANSRAERRPPDCGSGRTSPGTPAPRDAGAVVRDHGRERQASSCEERHVDGARCARCPYPARPCWRLVLANLGRPLLRVG